MSLTPERQAELLALAEAAHHPSCDDDCWDNCISRFNFEAVDHRFLLAWNPMTAKAILDLLAEKDTEIERSDQSLGDAIDDRDRIHAAADRIAYSLATVGQIGEHSSCNDPWQNVIDHVMGKIQRLERERDAALADRDTLREHILDIDAHATPFGDIPDDPGWIGSYLISAGCLHRALGKIGHTAPSCAAEAERDAALAKVAAVEEMLADWDAWTGDRDYRWQSSPKDRDRLRAALATGTTP